MSFPPSVFKFLIIAALILMSIAAISLIVMMLRDIKTKKLW